MNILSFFARRIIALVLGVAGFVYGLWIMFSLGDTGGGFAAIAGTALAVSLLVSDSF